MAADDLEGADRWVMLLDGAGHADDAPLEGSELIDECDVHAEHSDGDHAPQHVRAEEGRMVERGRGQALVHHDDRAIACALEDVAHPDQIVFQRRDRGRFATQPEVSPEGDYRRYELHDAERPGTCEKAIAGGQDASAGEGEHEAAITMLKGVHEHHERKDDDTVEGEQGAPAGALTLRAPLARSLPRRSASTQPR